MVLLKDSQEKEECDSTNDRAAALANAVYYNNAALKSYVDGAPHVKHASLRSLYNRLVVQIYNTAQKKTQIPAVLDLGAGDGSVTLPFLELGARVTAVDISRAQLDVLRDKCQGFRQRLDIRLGDVTEVVKAERNLYDIVVMNSFLHHIPDYLDLINRITMLIKPSGQFFSFQDPLRYDSLGVGTMVFSKLAYFSWRLAKGDLLGGWRRYVRRSRGIYLNQCVEDTAEYHVVRNGVDQDAIDTLFSENGFRCDVVRYFSTQSRIFQPLGAHLGIQNTFAIIAQKNKAICSSASRLL